MASLAYRAQRHGCSVSGVLADNSAFWYANMGSVPTRVCSLLGLILFSERAVVQLYAECGEKQSPSRWAAQALGTSERDRNWHSEWQWGELALFCQLCLLDEFCL